MSRSQTMRLVSLDIISFVKREIDSKVVWLYTQGIFLMQQKGLFVPDTIEAVCIEITKPKAKPILLTTVYRPPNSTVEFMDVLENYINLLDEQQKELLVTGDLNCDLSSSPLQSHFMRRLKDIFQLFQLNKLIVDPIRQGWIQTVL